MRLIAPVACSRITRTLLLASITLSCASGFGAGFDWPQWRGPDRSDVSRETGLLQSWPADGPKRVWLYDNAGSGYAGPSIVAGKLFTMGLFCQQHACRRLSG